MPMLRMLASVLLLAATAACTLADAGAPQPTTERSRMIESLPAIAGASSDAVDPARAAALEAGFAAYLRDAYRITDRRLLVADAGVPWVAARRQFESALAALGRVEPVRPAWHRAGHDLFALWTLADGRVVGLAMERDAERPLLGYFEVAATE